MDKPWKAFERTVSVEFGTTRALHGLSRTEGEVKTDVFVSVPKWYKNHLNVPIPECESRDPTALVIECKHSRRAEHPNRKLLESLHEMASRTPVKELDKIPILMLKDGWMWFQMRHFRRMYEHLFISEALQPCDQLFLSSLEIQTLGRKAAKFWEDAIAQAKQAIIPDDEKAEFHYARRLHVVATGSNIRVPPIIGLPPTGHTQRL